MSDQSLRERAQHDVMLGFYIHLGVYLAVNAGLMALDLSRNPDKTWFYWPLGGWGIGIVAHALAVFSSDQSRERLVNRRMQRLTERQAHSR